MIKKGKYEMAASIPQDAADLIRRSLQVDPNQRIDSREFLQHPWFTKNGFYRPAQIPQQILELSPGSSNIRQQAIYTNPPIKETNTFV